MAKALFCAVGALMLASCATGSGQSMMLTEDTALVTMLATPRQSREALLQATLQEAAKVTRSHGFRYFEVLGAEDASERILTIVPGRMVTPPNLGNRAYASGNLSAISMPGGSFSIPDQQTYRVKPGVDITIRMYREGGVDPARAGILNSDTMLAGNAH